jgi:hypothetical protein
MRPAGVHCELCKRFRPAAHADVRSGHTDAAVGAFEQLSAMTGASGTELALGIEAAKGALLRDDDSAEELYREAMERLGRTRMRVEFARAQLRYGSGSAGKAAAPTPGFSCEQPTRN